VFKYIVNGPINKNEKGDDDAVEEDDEEIMTDNNKVFDDI
jgi:hypothetical protein